MTTTHPAGTVAEDAHPSILDVAREQVLERGVRPDRRSRCSRCCSCRRRPARRPARAGPRGADALVRARGRGRGHRLAQDRRLPRGLPLLLAVRAVRLARCARPGSTSPRWSRPPSRPRRPAPPSSASSPPSAGPTSGCMAQVREGIAAIRDEVDINIACVARHAHPGAGRRARRRWACTATTTTSRPARSYFPNVVTTHTWEERWDTLRDGARGRHGGVLRRHRRHGRDPRAARRVRRPARRARARTRCR